MNNPQYFPEMKALEGVPYHTHDAADIEIPSDDTKVDKTTTVAGKPLSANVTLVKGDVGLGNVDNTTDAAKPISTATQTALNAKLTATKAVTQADSVATDVAGLVTDFNALLAKLKTAGVML